ncbi:hypothetical protein MTO96_004976 [Rhipicephalus appendiculatus]
MGIFGESRRVVGGAAGEERLRKAVTSRAAHRSQHAQYTVHVRHTVPVAGETVTELACWVAAKFLLYGLMQCSPFEIKDKLLKALDEDNNVVDMAAVIEVIGMLERTPITKDTLERTRLGKYINELRKRTSNDSLARRAKELVKSWRRLLPCDQQQTPNVPHAARQAPCSPGSPLAHPHPRSPPPLEPVAKNNVANKRLRKSVASSDGPDSAKKVAWSPPNGVHPWDPIPSGNSAFESVRNRIATTSTTSPRLPKVKTTQQLIADLKAKSGLSLDGSTAAAAAVAAAAAASATPPPSSSRPKRSGNYSLLGTDDETSRTKSELMDRFLKSSVPNGPSPASPTTAKSGASGEVAAILSALPEIGPEVELEEEEVPVVPLEVTPEVEERFATQQWAFVNGVYDHEGQWRGWHEVTTGRSYGGGPSSHVALCKYRLVTRGSRNEGGT